MRSVSTAVVLAAALSACGRSQPATAPVPPATPGPSASSLGAAAASGGAYVNAAAVLRREPTDAARVPGPTPRKELPNVLATLQRGERLTVVELREDWAKVRASDDAEGWIRRGALLEGDGIVEATVLAPADVFDRPDLLAANAKRKIEPGTLVLVVKARPPFSEVNLSGAQDAWVLTERLATGEKEVSVAKLIEKARWLVRVGKKDDALQILALARQHFSAVPLVDQLALELGEVPPTAAGGVVVPASGTLPAPPAAAPTAPAPPPG